MAMVTAIKQTISLWHNNRQNVSADCPEPRWVETGGYEHATHAILRAVVRNRYNSERCILNGYGYILGGNSELISRISIRKRVSPRNTSTGDSSSIPGTWLASEWILLNHVGRIMSGNIGARDRVYSTPPFMYIKKRTHRNHCTQQTRIVSLREGVAVYRRAVVSETQNHLRIFWIDSNVIHIFANFQFAQGYPWALSWRLMVGHY